MKRFILEHVSKSFSRHAVLKDISLSVEEGSTVGIVGSNGSGKSVLFQIICGFYPPDSGTVRVRGELLGKGRDFPENIGVLINFPGFISLDTGLHNLQYLAGIRGVIGDRNIRAAMRKVGLDPEDRTHVEHYSLGMKQKLGLAQAIMEGQDIERNNFHDFETFAIYKWIIKTFVAVYLVSHTFDITMAIFELAQNIVQRSAGIISGTTSLDFAAALGDVSVQLDTMGVGELFGLLVETMLLKITMPILPCREQADKWTASSQNLYRSILERADSIVYVSRDYHKNCLGTSDLIIQFPISIGQEK